METRTVNDLVTALKNEAKWFRNAARKHALNASVTAVATTRIAELVEQEAHMRVGEKLAEWADRFDEAVKEKRSI